MPQKSGIDINLGNESSRIAFRYATETFGNRSGKKGTVISKADGGFSNLLQFGNERIGIGSDGIGTKAELAERTGIYHTLGFDLTAMVADDLAAAGLEPTNLSNVIDVDFLDKNIIEQLMRGLRDACNFAGITITGGEIAELGNRVGGYGDKMHFNWNATAIGVLPENLPADIDGSQVKAGDLIISLQSRGFRSNGFSAIRRIMQERFGDEWHNRKYDEKTTWGEKLLTPSLIYAPVITKLIRKNLIPNGIAHITGGGIIDNLQRVLKMTGTGAVLDKLFEPHPEMLKIKDMGNVSYIDAYRWWNMGNGMLLAVDKDKADDFADEISSSGYTCKIAGYVTKDKQIVIQTPDVQLVEKY
jgi:phosphoribosylformylglycinamidine cyclo-ligase